MTKIDGREIKLNFNGEILDTVQVNDEMYTCTKAKVEMKTLTPMFLAAEINPNIPDRIYWEIQGKGKTIKFEGFNYCFFPEQPGDYKIKYGTKELNVMVVKNAGVKYAKTITDLETLLSKAKPNELISISNDIEFTKPLTINGTLITKTGKERLIYVGPQIPNKELIYLNKDACIHSVNVVNKTYSVDSRDLTSHIFHCSGNNVINRVKASGMRCFTNLQNRPSFVKVSNCSVWENTLWDYFVWMSGEYITIESNTIGNSRREHIVRGNNYKYVTIINNNFTNLDRRPEDSDISKGCIVAQYGEYIYIHGNTATLGGIGLGPLGRNDGKQYPEKRVKFAVVTNNVCNQVQMQVLHGTEYFRVEDNTADIWFENTEVGYPKERTFKYGRVKGTIVNPPKNFVDVILL